MRVCFRRGYHHAYDELVNFPPSGVEYVMPPFVTPSKPGFASNLKRSVFRSYVNIFNKPNAVSVNPMGASLIHSGGGFLIKNKSPWVIDLEHAASCVGFQAGRLEKVKKQIENYLSSDHCKKVMPWTDAGKKSITNGLDSSKFKDKMEVLYPAMHHEEIKKKKTDKPVVLFVSVRFFTKGGREVLQAYDKLKEKFDFDLVVISNVPDDLKKKYPSVEFIEPNIPREVLLRDYFSKADIFLLPTYMDTYGMVFLEAMSYGIPIVTTNVFAIPEIVDGSGILIDADKYSWYGKDYLFSWKSWDKWTRFVEKEEKPEIVDGIVKGVSSLLEKDSERKKMSKRGKQLIDTKFSIDRRNESLKRIYEESSRI